MPPGVAAHVKGLDQPRGVALKQRHQAHIAHLGVMHRELAWEEARHKERACALVAQGVLADVEDL